MSVLRVARRCGIGRHHKHAPSRVVAAVTVAVVGGTLGALAIRALLIASGDGASFGT